MNCNNSTNYISSSCIDGEGKRLLSAKITAQLPISPPWGHALRVASQNHCLEEMIILAAIENTQQSILIRPHSVQAAAYSVRRQFTHPLSDHITLLNVFHAFTKFCAEVAEGDETSIEKVRYIHI
jgi:pre-mRNA-splicing factor ATP-dependent RNA helicase DHX15/PRP43